MIRRILLLFLLTMAVGAAWAQSSKEITLEMIWRDYKFFPKMVPGFSFMEDGQHYSQLDGNKIVAYDITTGKKSGVVLDGDALEAALPEISAYRFNDGESHLLLETGRERIYRRSSRADYFLYDREKEVLQRLSDKGKVQYATYSPDASKVAFVYDNNLYYKDLLTGEERPVTTDGKYNHIINGATDWVYEEEFSITQAFAWSPDSKRIAFLRFDESGVREFTMKKYNDDIYPEHVTFKYPKVGEANVRVTAHIHDLEQGQTLDVELPDYEYLPRLQWTQDAGQLCLTSMNRWQNHLHLLLVDAQSGKSRTLLEEKNKHYIDIHDNLQFLKDGKHFVWTSEADGYHHAYLYDMEGKLLRQLTQGSWEVTDFYGVNEEKGRIYFQATKESPLERHLYSSSLKGGHPKRLSEQKGWNEAQFSRTFDYYVNEHSTANSPFTFTVHDHKGKKVREIADNKVLEAAMQSHQVQPKEFFRIETPEGVELNGWMIKPTGFDPSKEYPLLMTEYGGPGSQEVTDKWDSFDYWWHQMLAQLGFVIACVDNRGTGGRGEAFKKMTYLQLGKYETEDQIAAAKWLGEQPYIDAGRIGIFGWSYGGYLSSLCILKGSDTFKAAIAVAPVTNWKWYDSIYTERYMRDTQENGSGYKENSPVYFAEQLKGNYLLVHGLADDNVHFQHSAEMAKELVKANKQFDTYVYTNHAHGIFGGNARLHLFTKLTSFLEKSLKQ